MPEQIENRMVVDAEWRNIPQEVKEALKGKGYYDPGTGNFVPEPAAYEYALGQCLYGIKEEFKKMLVEWYFSSWIKEE